MYSSSPSLTLAQKGGGWSAPRLGCFTPGKDPVPIVQVAGWAPSPVWTGSQSPRPGFDPRTFQPSSCTSSFAYIYSDTSANEDNSFRNHIR